jgi:hypothetical protein
MKLRITLKDPDGIYESLNDAAAESVPRSLGLSDGEMADLTESRRETLQHAVKPWVKYGEYVTIEIDTDAKTATVVPL